MLHREAAATARRVLIELLALEEADRPILDSLKAPIDSDVDYNHIGITVLADGRGELYIEDPAIRLNLQRSLQLSEVESQSLLAEKAVAEDKVNRKDFSSPGHAELVAEDSKQRIERFRAQLDKMTLAQTQGSEKVIEEPQSSQEDQSWLTISLSDLDFKFAV